MSKEKKLWILIGTLGAILLAGILVIVFAGGEKTPDVAENPTTTVAQGVPESTDITTVPETTGVQSTEESIGATTDATTPSATTGNHEETTTPPAPTTPGVPPAEGEGTEPEQPAPTTPSATTPVTPEDPDEDIESGQPEETTPAVPTTPVVPPVEDGTNTQRSDVAMLLVHNDSDHALEYTQITVEFPEETLEFYISALPAGQRVVVQEHTGKTVPEDVPSEVKVMLVQRLEMSVAEGLSVKDNGDNSLTVENLTNKDMETVRVFYKYYMEEEDIYVGGIAFTAKISRLPAKGKLVIRPSHYASQTSRVVMAQIYDTNG